MSETVLKKLTLEKALESTMKNIFSLVLLIASAFLISCGFGRITANLPAEFTSDDLKKCLENFYKKYAEPTKKELRIF